MLLAYGLSHFTLSWIWACDFEIWVTPLTSKYTSPIRSPHGDNAHPPTPPIIALNDLIFIKAKVEIVAQGVGASLIKIDETGSSFAFNI